MPSHVAIVVSMTALVGCSFIWKSQRRLSRQLDEWEKELDRAEDRYGRFEDTE